MANAIGNTLYEIRQTEHLILLPGVWWGGERESETTLVALNFFFFFFLTWESHLLENGLSPGTVILTPSLGVDFTERRGHEDKE